MLLWVEKKKENKTNQPGIQWPTDWQTSTTVDAAQ